MTKYREVLLGFWVKEDGEIIANEFPEQEEDDLRHDMRPGIDGDRGFIIRCRIPARSQDTPDDGLPIAEEVKP